MAAVNIDTAGLGTAIASIGGLAKDIRSAITGKVDPALALQVESHLADLEAQANTAQASINAVEAASSSFFVAGWRPAIGWICTIAVFVNFIVVWVLKVVGLMVPVIPSDELWPLMLGMLGIGTLRSIDKKNGVAR